MHHEHLTGLLFDRDGHPSAAQVISDALGIAGAIAFVLIIALGGCNCEVDVAISNVPALAIGRLSPQIVEDQRMAAIAVADTAIAGHNGRVAGAQTLTMASTSDGRALLSVLISCALPSSVAITAVVDGIELEFPGEIGLAPGWRHEYLDHRERRWVSACVFARMSGTAVATAVSLRGQHPALRTDHDEIGAWPFEEGAFFGNLFGEGAIDWNACSGRHNPVGGDRACAQIDPDRPGISLCGLALVGRCDDACDRHRGVYRGCRRHPGDDPTDEVITTFLQ